MGVFVFLGVIALFMSALAFWRICDIYTGND